MSYISKDVGFVSINLNQNSIVKLVSFVGYKGFFTLTPPLAISLNTMF